MPMGRKSLSHQDEGRTKSSEEDVFSVPWQNPLGFALAAPVIVHSVPIRTYASLGSSERAPALRNVLISLFPLRSPERRRILSGVW